MANSLKNVQVARGGECRRSGTGRCVTRGASGEWHGHLFRASSTISSRLVWKLDSAIATTNYSLPLCWLCFRRYHSCSATVRWAGCSKNIPGGIKKGRYRLAIVKFHRHRCARKADLVDKPIRPINRPIASSWHSNPPMKSSIVYVPLWRHCKVNC